MTFVLGLEAIIKRYTGKVRVKSEGKVHNRPRAHSCFFSSLSISQNRALEKLFHVEFANDIYVMEAVDFRRY